MEEVGNNLVLKMFHPADAFAENLHAYILTITPSLKCRMDVQSTDGKGMLLKCAASYVSKWQDSFDNNALFSVHVGPYEAGYKFLKGLRPLEPQMWMSLTSKKISWTQSRTKKLTVPISDSVQPESHKAYWKRPRDDNNLSFLKWLRLYHEKQKPPKKYRTGTTLVACKLRSPNSDEYFFPQLVLHLPHRKVVDLLHPRHEELPKSIAYFAAAWHHLDLWKDPEKVGDYFSMQGNKAHYVDNMVAFVKSRIDLLRLWERKVIGAFGNELIADEYAIDSLSQRQKSVVNAVDNFLSQREDYYNDVPEVMQHDTEVQDDDDDSVIIDTNTDPPN